MVLFILMILPWQVLHGALILLLQLHGTRGNGREAKCVMCSAEGGVPLIYRWRGGKVHWTWTYPLLYWAIECPGTQLFLGGDETRWTAIRKLLEDGRRRRGSSGARTGPAGPPLGPFRPSFGPGSSLEVSFPSPMVWACLGWRGQAFLAVGFSLKSR